jgi:hypothetical protein
MTSISERYVMLVLSVGQHDESYVDAYYGPADLKSRIEGEKPELSRILEDARALHSELSAAGTPRDEMEAFRHRFLIRQLEALQSHVERLNGKRMTFDEESQALYDAVAPTHPEEHFQAILDQMDRAIPGTGTAAEKYEAFRRDFIIPREKLDAVFRLAIAEGRSRTRREMTLPEGEDFTFEFVNDKAWSGYNWYQGNFRSLIQVNVDLPIYVDRAIDLAAHEGYPGHHVYNMLLEKHLARDRGWIEFTIYPLYSPMSLVAEGSANYGIDVAFPGRERVEYEAREIFPAAGLDASRAEQYYEIHDLAHQLSYAGNEAARRYLNGEIEAEAAAEWLTKYALFEPDRARQRVRFFDAYRSYVINYNLGRDLVGRYIESRGGTADNPEVRWREFEKLLAAPKPASELV